MHRLLSVVMLFLAICTALALPLSPRMDTVVDIEKRITHSGRGTWFHPGQGRCGGTQTDSSPIAAMATSFYDQNNGGNCGQWIQIENTANGNTTWALMMDSCDGCGYHDLDVSPRIFSQVASLEDGVFHISWNFMPKGWQPY